MKTLSCSSLSVLSALLNYSTIWVTGDRELIKHITTLLACTRRLARHMPCLASATRPYLQPYPSVLISRWWLLVNNASPYRFTGIGGHGDTHATNGATYNDRGARDRGPQPNGQHGDLNTPRSLRTDDSARTVLAHNGRRTTGSSTRAPRHHVPGQAGGATTLALGFRAARPTGNRAEDLATLGKAQDWPRRADAHEAPQVHATGVARKDLTKHFRLAREAPTPTTAQRDITRILPKTGTPRGELILSTKRTGTAGGGSRTVPTREDSLTVVIDTTNSGTSGGGPAAYQLDSRPTAHSTFLHPRRRRHTDGATHSLFPLDFARTRIKRKPDFSKGEERDGTHGDPTELISEGPTGPDRFGAASARAEVPIGNI
ncbi:hypothetical protein MVEN_00317500 [Mycena venus]|uniref:Secreted protein n=1 Tax=Mycena venus TaxID=2733690 RepID=A0A8H6YUD4_9AGAR|nr:hypothetical protein MVEN_00317500 [Mycena venus]